MYFFLYLLYNYFVGGNNMNPFISGPALLKAWGEISKFNKNAATLDKLRQSGDVVAERELIHEKEVICSEGIFDKLKVNIEIEGAENIPSAGPIMVYSNHQSLVDIPAIIYLFKDKFQMGFISKAEWKKLKPLAKAIEYTRSVFLVRGGGREALTAINEATELLKQGFSLCIFPEGTRSKKHEMGEFKPGSFKFAERGGVPILPVTLDGGYKTFEETGNFKPNQTIKIKVHPLVHIENMDRKQLKEAAVQIEETIRSGLEK